MHRYIYKKKFKVLHEIHAEACETHQNSMAGPFQDQADPSTVINLKSCKEQILLFTKRNEMQAEIFFRERNCIRREESSIETRRPRTDDIRTHFHKSRNSFMSKLSPGSSKCHHFFPFKLSNNLLPLLFILFILQQLLHNQKLTWSNANSIAPTIDYSHNMRILKLPKTTPTGSLVYRLKGSDGDPNTQLTFGVLGPEARSLLEILPVPSSWNEADVYLRSNLEQFIASQPQQQQNLQPQVNITLYVSDGNMTTQVESTILITDPELEVGASANSDQLLQQTSAFINTNHIFNIPENLQLDEPLGQVSVLESDSSELPVRFELRGKGAEKFSIRYVFGPRGQSRGQIHLAQSVDYEKQNLFNLKVLALNAWTDTKWDTRNVVTMDIVITLSDVQDTAPIFKSAPSSLRLTNVMQVGDLIGLVEAEDGDLGDQRPIHFALDASSPLANYFSIDKLSGQIRLMRTMQELGLHAAWDSPTWSVLTIIASEPPDPASYDRLWPPMYSKLDLPLMLVDIVNEPPQFLGGWQTTSATVPETSPKSSNLRKFTKRNNKNDLIKSQAITTSTTNGHVRPGQLTNGAISINNEMVASSSMQTLNWIEGDRAALNVPAATLHAFLPELTKINQDPSGMLVRWYTNGSSGDSSSSFVRPIVMDLGLGQNGSFQVHLEGPDASLFRLEPSVPVAKQSNLVLFVADSVASSNWSLFDSDSPNGRGSFRLELVARDLGQPQRMSSRIFCQIDLLDANDNAPQFESDLYSFSVYESAQKGHIVGLVRARDPDTIVTNKQRSIAGAALRYGPISGAQSHLFKIVPESGQILLDGKLDREREQMYLLLVEVSDSAGNFNYTKVLIQILDVNDNSPQFLQSHYDAVLLPDGTFHEPIVVKALDADEPGTANSQVAYEIIAGNRDEQFLIDSLSGHIYPSSQQLDLGQDVNNRHQLLPPPAITMPIEPYNKSRPTSGFGFSLLPNGAKLLPGREIEETTANPSGISRLINMDMPRKRDQQQQQQDTDLMKLESMLEDADQVHYKRSLANNYNQKSSSKLPPIITLIVRAHDFGIPLRSSTVRVNIYNQAQLARSLSVILNGTADQIDARRDSIERAFSSLTGTRATIESVESLSDSSSLCLAHFKLVVPQHNLVDLTDLSALMDAIDYRPHSYTHPYSHANPPQHELHKQPTRNSQSHNTIELTSNSINNNNNNNQVQFHSGPANITSMLPDFTHPFHISNNQFDSVAIERRLLIYIIIVAICILSLLVLWMVYSCNNQTTTQNRNIQASNHLAIKASQFESSKRMKRHLSEQARVSLDTNQQNKLSRSNKGTNTKLGLDEASYHGKKHQNTASSLSLLASPLNGTMNLLQVPYKIGPDGMAQALANPPDRLSMYNGQVWFEPMPLNVNDLNEQQKYFLHDQLAYNQQPRALSAPSINGLHLRATDVGAANQPTTSGRGYMPSLETSLSGYKMAKQDSGRVSQKRNSKRRVAPIMDQATGVSSAPTPNKQRSNISMSSNEQDDLVSSGGETLVLDSDQELLGFDSTGTPIIATLTNGPGLKQSSILNGSEPNDLLSGPRSSFVTDQNGQLILHHRTQSPIQAPSDTNKTNSNLPSNQNIDNNNNRTTSSKQRTIAKSQITTAIKNGEPNGQQNNTRASEIKNNDVMNDIANHSRENHVQVSGSDHVVLELNQRLEHQRKSIDQQTENGRDTFGVISSKTKEDDNANKVESDTSNSHKQAKITQWKTVDEPNKVDEDTKASGEQAGSGRKLAHSASSQNHSTDGNQSDATINEVDTKGPPTSRSSFENQMKNGDLLKKQSIFALTYNQLASDQLPTDQI